jgi:hypothetical protein
MKAGLFRADCNAANKGAHLMVEESSTGVACLSAGAAVSAVSS